MKSCLFVLRLIVLACVIGFAQDNFCSALPVEAEAGIVAAVVERADLMRSALEVQLRQKSGSGSEREESGDSEEEEKSWNDLTLRFEPRDAAERHKQQIPVRKKSGGSGDDSVLDLGKRIGGIRLAGQEQPSPVRQESAGSGEKPKRRMTRSEEILAMDPEAGKVAMKKWREELLQGYAIIEEMVEDMSPRAKREIAEKIFSPKRN